MKKLLTTLLTAATVTAASTSMARASESGYTLLEQLQIDPHMPVAELSAIQFVQILQQIPASPVTPPTCATFSSLPLGNSYASGNTLSINGIDFEIQYSGGARVNDWPTYPGTHFLEMVESGVLIIRAPFSASQATLEVIQAGPDPIFAEIFSSNGHMGTLQTSLYNDLNLLSWSSSQVDTIEMHGTEAFVYEVCFYQ